MNQSRNGNRVNRRTIMQGAVAGGVALGFGGVSVQRIAAHQATPTALSGTATSAIFFLGDGMGPAHREAGTLNQLGPFATLIMDRLPVTAMVGTNSADPNLITDSAAAATAFAAGVKTLNGAVGVDVDGNPVKTIAEYAKAAGKSIGLVTTSQVTDASPACFASHVLDRDQQSEIARQYIEELGVDVILGGGEDRWLPKGTAGAYPDNSAEDPEEESSSGQGNLIEKARQLGYEYISDAKGLSSAKGPKVLGLFANEEMFQQRPEGKGDVYDPVVSLQQMTQKAIEILSQNANGFFLFVEEEAIDEFSHQNNSTYVLKGVSELEKAVGSGLAYASSSADTLILVTADHECGGLTVEAVDAKDESGATEGDLAISAEDGPFDVANSDQKYVLDWTTTGHSGVRVPLTATGPGAEGFNGTYENTDIFFRLAAALGITVETPGANSGTPAATPAS